MSTQDLRDEVIRTIRRIIRAIDLQSKRLVKNYGLTGPQLLIIKKLHASGGMTVSELAREINVSQSTVTSILDRLERYGYVVRSRSDADRRRVIVNISDSGNKILSENPSLLHESFLSRFEKLTDWEQTALLSSLQRVASMMDAPELEESSVLISGSFEEPGGESGGGFHGEPGRRHR
jgi:DNA-binding MarR family transcriptional regulator